MVVKHNKTENLYLLVNDKCKVKINGEWVDAVIYQGKDKESGKTKCFVREKSDFDSHFTEVGGIELNLESSWLFYKIYKYTSNPSFPTEGVIFNYTNNKGITKTYKLIGNFGQIQ